MSFCWKKNHCNKVQGYISMQMWQFSCWCLIENISQRFSPSAHIYTQLPSLVLLKLYKYKDYKDGLEKTLPSCSLSALPQICHRHSSYLPGSLLPAKCSFCHLEFRYSKQNKTKPWSAQVLQQHDYCVLCIHSDELTLLIKQRLC